MRFLNFIDNLFIKLIKQEPDPINKERIRMLGYILFFYNVFTVLLIVTYTIGDKPYHLVRVSSVFLATIILGCIAHYTKFWKLISQAILVIITLGVWTNIAIFVRDVNIETLQYIWFACALSFYMLGSKWGWFYSAVNIIPVLAFTIADDKSYYFLGSSTYDVSHPVYVIVTFYNFVMIVFLQYYFFKSFNKNFIKLKKAKSHTVLLNEKLNRTLSEVEKLSNSRMEFLSTMSHEIRTPLNGVIGITNILLIDNPRKDQEENLDMLKFSAENLLLLVNNVLDVTKLDSDKTVLENVGFDLAELLTRAYVSSKLTAIEKKLDFKLYIDPDLQGKIIISDPTRITQVLLNLINNSVKFTKEGHISIAAHVLRVSKKKIKVQFTIEDTGIGILAEKHEVVFEQFMQASASTNRNYGGTGLGLPIVKKILKMFDSSITLTSQENVGSKFVFDIEFNYIKLEQPTSKITVKAQNDLSGFKVLVAEDNTINKVIIEKILKNWNISPVIVTDGALAVARLEQEDFDVVLMDVHMPVMDGYEATARIRKLENATKASTPIIALTASVSEKAFKAVFDSNMNDYLSKPYNPDHLFAKLKAIADQKLNT